MRHLPFLKVLASATDTSDPVWRDAAGGYLVLRLFDRWLEEGRGVLAGDPELTALKSRIRAIPDIDPIVQDHLLSAIQVMGEASEANPALVAGPLLAYGKYLQSAGRQELAAHVYETLIAVLDPPHRDSDPLPAVSAHMHYAFVTRLLGQFDASREAYQRAEARAQEAGAIALILRARIGMANTLRALGNLGDAEALLDRALAYATEAGLANAQSGALHNRGAVRNLRGRSVEAMQDLFRAYELTDDPAEREVILGDLAACAGDAGYQHLARDAHRILAYTARTPNVRSAALGNLLELAALSGNAAEFERIQRHIQLHAEQHPLPAEHAIHIQLNTAYGVERFGTRTAAIESYRSVMSQAHEAGFHQVAFKAEQALNALVTGAASTPLLAHEPPDALRHIAEAIAGWSRLATAAP